MNPLWSRAVIFRRLDTRADRTDGPVPQLCYREVILEESSRLRSRLVRLVSCADCVWTERCEKTGSTAPETKRADGLRKRVSYLVSFRKRTRYKNRER